MKIIHCADVHLDSAFTAHFDRDRARQRKKEVFSTFRRMMIYAEQNDICAVIIAGDLFDADTVSSGTIDAVFDEIGRHKGVDVYYLRGNHDPGTSIWGAIRTPDNLHMFDDNWSYYLLNNDTDDVRTEKSNIVLAGVVMNAENCNSLYSELDLRESDFNIVTLHGQEREYGEAHSPEDICMERLRDQYIDYLALGHIHKSKKARLDHRGIYCYPGCLEGRGFDECGQHGFVVLDIDEDTRRCSAEFVPFAYRVLYDLDINISEIESGEELDSVIEDQIYTYIYSEKDRVGKDIARITLRGEIGADNEVSTDYIQKEFKDMFYYLEIRNMTDTCVDINQYMRDATLKGEFVRMVMQQDIPEEDKIFIIRAGLKALAGEEIWTE